LREWEKHYGALPRKSTDAIASCGSADRAFAVFVAQIVDAFVQSLERSALVTIQERLLPTGPLQRARAHSQKSYGSALDNISPH
jgi:hypothetical protein